MVYFSICLLCHLWFLWSVFYSFRVQVFHLNPFLKYRPSKEHFIFFAIFSNPSLHEIYRYYVSLFMYSDPLEGQKIVFFFYSPQTNFCLFGQNQLSPQLKIYRVDEILWIVFWDTEITNHSISCPQTVRFYPPYSYRPRSYKTKEHSIKKK